MNTQPSSHRSSGCPSAESIRAFHSGRLPGPEMEALADHLGVCTACAVAFDGLEDDAIVSKLRQYLPRRTPALDPECERLAAAARMIPLEPTGADTSLRDTPSYGPRTPAVPPPRRFAGYDLLEQFGTGGMGVVWKARHLRLNRVVALKLVRFASAAEEPERERFRREGEAVARVRHPNVVEIYDADEEENQPYIAMELLEAGTLARWVRDRSPTDREAAELVRTLARAVQAAHDKGVVHRDLKPTNVLFAADGTPKVTDFGLAKLLDAETGHTRAGDVLGTPSYMAPEQARGETALIGPRTDVYGLGAILYELLHGRPPFRGANRKATLDEVVHGRLPAARAKIDKARRGLEAICGKCLEKEPGDRYPSAAALAEDLDRWLQHGRADAKRPGTLVRAGRLIRRRKFLAASLAACSLGATAGLAGWWFLRPDPDAAIQEIERRLARGETVELIGSGPTSGPAWSQVVLGTAMTDRSDDNDRDFRFQSFSPGGLLELVRDPQMDTYTIRAEVRHESDQEFGAVGVYFGRRSYTAAAENVHVFVQMSFNDRHSRRDQIRHWNDDHPKGPRRDMPKANAVQVSARVWRRQPGALDNPDTYMLSFAELLQPNEQWRSLAVVVTPEQIRFTWEGDDRPELSFPPALVGAEIQRNLAAFHKPNQFPGGAAPPFVPRGALGLFAYQGAASFRNIRVGPPDRMG